MASSSPPAPSFPFGPPPHVVGLPVHHVQLVQPQLTARPLLAPPVVIPSFHRRIPPPFAADGSASVIYPVRPTAAAGTSTALQSSTTTTASTTPPTAPAAPPTTAATGLRVYVGRIHVDVTEAFINAILQECGTVINWIRDKDPNTNRFASFGFCEFDGPSSVYQALHTLNGFKVYGDPLLVKCGQAVKATVDKWHEGRVKTLSRDSEEDVDKRIEAQLEKTTSALQKIVAKFPRPAESETAKKASEAKEAEETAEADAQMNGEPKKFEVKPGERGLSRSYRQHRKERARLARLAEKDAQLSKDYKRIAAEWEAYEEKRKNGGSTFASREAAEEEITERQKAELIALDLRGEWWEGLKSRRRREDRKRRRDREREEDNYDREEEKREKLIAAEEEKETKRRKGNEEGETKQHAAEERPVSPSPSASAKPRHPSLGTVFTSLANNAPVAVSSPPPVAEAAPPAALSAGSSALSLPPTAGTTTLPSPVASNLFPSVSAVSSCASLPSATPSSTATATSVASSSDPFLGGVSLVSKAKLAEGLTKRFITQSATRKQTVKSEQKISNVFGEAEDEGGLFSRQHRPLTKLEQHRDLTNQKTEAEERKRLMEQSKQILAQIPMEQEALFSYPIRWNVIEENQIIERKLRPWVRKKVIEYMGSDEKLVKEVIDYVIGRIGDRPQPQDLLTELVKFLDEDGEAFVKNMWRMLIYEQTKTG